MKLEDIIEEGARSDIIADKVLQMAEASAYNEGAERGNVTSDEVFAAAQRILADVEQAIVQRLEAEMR